MTRFEYAAFDRTGARIATGRTAEEAADRARRVLGPGPSYLEEDPDVPEEQDAPYVANAADPPGRAMQRTGLPVLHLDDDVSSLAPEDAFEELAPVFRDIAPAAATSPSTMWRKMLASNYKLAKTPAGAAAWVVGLSLVPEARVFRESPHADRVLQSIEGVPNPSLCAGSNDLCRRTCLVYSGNNVLTNTPRMAKLAKTTALYAHPAAFVRMLCAAIAYWQRRVGNDYQLFVRSNVYSDIPWELFVVDDRGPGALMRRFPRVTFYDYTKVPRRDPRHYDLTFSYSGTNERLVADEINGYRRRIAVVFAIGANDPKPHAFDFGGLTPPLRVVDGDLSDLRPRDPPGVVVGLSYKPTTAAQQAPEGSAFIVPVVRFPGSIPVIAGVPRFENAAGGRPDPALDDIAQE